MGKPEFDPSKPFAPAQADQKPEFDPGKPFEPAQSEEPQHWYSMSGKGLIQGGLNALPTAGMALGGIGGAAAGTAIEPGGGTAFGGMMGAGLGQGAGQNLKDLGEMYLLGKDKTGKEIRENATGAVPQGMMADMGGQVVGKAGGLIKQGLAHGAEFASGGKIPADAAERVLSRPYEVEAAQDPRAALATAQNAQQELEAKNALEGGLISKARKQAASQYGDIGIDTSPAVKRTSDFVFDKAPVNGEQGALDPKELNNLSGFVDNRLTSKSPEGDILPEKSFKSLQNFADYLGTEVKRFDQSKLPGSGDTPYQSQLRQLYGQAKDLLHQASPELAAADARYSQYANEAGRLGRLDNPDTMESFANNFYGKNKTMMRDSAERLIPESIEPLKDLAAGKSLNNATGYAPLLTKHGLILAGKAGQNISAPAASASASGLLDQLSYPHGIDEATPNAGLIYQAQQKKKDENRKPNSQ